MADLGWGPRKTAPWPAKAVSTSLCGRRKPRFAGIGDELWSNVGGGAQEDPHLPKGVSEREDRFSDDLHRDDTFFVVIVTEDSGG